MFKFSMGSIVLGGAMMMLAGPALSAEPQSHAGWKLAVQTYTFNRFTFFEAVDKVRSLGLRTVEGFAWQKISPELGNAQLNPGAPAEALDAVSKKLDQAGVKLVCYYVADFGKNEAEMRKMFAFAKKMGIEVFVAEPKGETLGLLDKLAQEFGLKIAIHNHPKNPNKPDYTNWDPDQVMKMIRPCSKHVGCCADTGHWIRSGLDPVTCLKKYQGRLISLHLKDVNKKGPGAHDVPFGTGVGNFKGQLEELNRQKFTGVIAIEYEHNMENNLPDLRQSVSYYNKIAGNLAPTR